MYGVSFLGLSLLSASFRRARSKRCARLGFVGSLFAAE